MDSYCILIVDDDIEDIELFIEAAHEVDPSIKCLSAQNGVEGIHLIRSLEIKPDYVFVDLNMPKMNGKQFVAEIRKDASCNAIRLIIYTTSWLEKDCQETALLGANGFITKPTSQVRLCKVIAEIVRKPYPGKVSKP